MFVIVPLGNVPSPEKTERVSMPEPTEYRVCCRAYHDLMNGKQFLGLISKIGPFTHQNELRCHAYAWFRNAGDNDGVPHHWVRGLEALVLLTFSL